MKSYMRILKMERNMRRIKLLGIGILSIIFMVACSSSTSWQEQYDLGMKYLTEGKYEEAVFAFTAAIKIDPKLPKAYVGRGNAYIGVGETEENLSKALADYEEAILLDETYIDAYLGIADIYIWKGECEKAVEILEKALEKTENTQPIFGKLEEIKREAYNASSKKIKRSNRYNTKNQLIEYIEYEYDFL